MSVAFSFSHLLKLRLPQRTSGLDFYAGHWRFPEPLDHRSWSVVGQPVCGKTVYKNHLSFYPASARMDPGELPILNVLNRCVPQHLLSGEGLDVGCIALLVDHKMQGHL